ncbi:MAG: dihydroorotate dehydrogenase-like protein, partial [Propionibacterium sp.]|nr:dihydroorotate dehydrogenase-like protein [Propionibacterium sp.]
MSKFDPEALQAAAESHRQKTAMGSSATDQLAPNGSQVVEAELNQLRPLDLRTRYMGLWLRNPVVASAGPLSQTADGIKSLAAGGVGAIVMYSLFEEQIRHEAARETALEEQGAESFAEALSYFPTAPSNDSGLTRTYLELLEKAAPVIDVPLIASLNGSTTGDWTQNARRMQDAGAAAIELNVYYVPGDITTPAREVEQRYLDILDEVKSRVSVPVAMKLSPYLSSFGKMAQALDAAGVDGLVLFNRYLQPDIDLDQMAVVPGFGLSTQE